MVQMAAEWFGCHLCFCTALAVYNCRFFQKTKNSKKFAKILSQSGRSNVIAIEALFKGKTLQNFMQSRMQQ